MEIRSLSSVILKNYQQHESKGKDAARFNPLLLRLFITLCMRNMRRLV